MCILVDEDCRPFSINQFVRMYQNVIENCSLVFFLVPSVVVSPVSVRWILLISQRVEYRENCSFGVFICGGVNDVLKLEEPLSRQLIGDRLIIKPSSVDRGRTRRYYADVTLHNVRFFQQCLDRGISIVINSFIH